jgi:hypothetical protein
MSTPSLLLAGAVFASPAPTIPVELEALTGPWASAWKSSLADGIRPWRDSLRLQLMHDGSFRTFSPPDIRHRGSWTLRPDSTIVLHLKALETWRIVELTDTSLVLRALWGPDTSAFTGFQRVHSLRVADTALESFTPPPPRREPAPPCQIAGIDTLPPVPGAAMFEVDGDEPGIRYQTPERTLRFRMATGPYLELTWSPSPPHAYWLTLDATCALDPRTAQAVPLLERRGIGSMGFLRMHGSELEIRWDNTSLISFRPDPDSPIGYTPQCHHPPRRHKGKRKR